MSSRAPTDPELIALLARVACQDETALKALYDSCGAKLHGLALRVLAGQRDAAGDALQEAFLQIWQQAGDYRASLSPPLAWMGLIVRSRALDLLRRSQARREDRKDPLDEQLAADTPDPLDLQQASQQAWALHQCLQRLEGRQRQLLGLAYLRELSHGELAQQLSLPLGTVKTWIRRGLDRMRDCMAQFA